ncbi:hypothetical protein HOLleu_45089 [Holothuria leucospilota]|uniref:exodeoxyribonuclease III n=1 Tax=Holothuria leucospilota TaxID=206669 RepID=A0A9Q1BAJ3_HOLLE|nr:hypothetical protein HOLleu_45089 [Holothuria leucospilota]
MVDDITVITYNARGLRNHNKRRRLFSYLHRSKPHISFIQETHSLPADEKIWKNEWGGKVIFSHGTHDSCGVSILFNPTVDLEIKKCVSHDGGRFIITEVTFNTTILTVVALYGPNIDNPSFFVQLFNIISTFSTENLIIGGDFNFVFNLALDKKGGQQRTNFNARNECLSFMTGLSLIDIWRERNPRSISFTWSSNILSGLHCRLDFFLISRHMLHSVNDVSHSPGIQSDHSFVNLSLSLFTEKRVPGYWKFNNSLLQDPDYLDIITNVINSFEENHTYSNPSLRWEGLKFILRKESIKYAKEKAKARRCREDELTNEVANLEQALYISDSTETRTKLNDARNELLLFYDMKLQGTIIRSRARWVEQGEKNTKYFLNLERRNKICNTIHKICDDNGNTYINGKSILHNIKCFYENLYVSNPCSPQLILDDLPPPSPFSTDDFSTGEGELNLNECSMSLNSSKNDKSPGSDGFSVNLNKTFWHLIGNYVLDSLNYAYSHNGLSYEQSRA